MRCRKGIQPLCSAISLFVSTTSVERVLTSLPVHQNVTHGRGSRLCDECNAAVECYILAISSPFGRVRGRCGTSGLETYSMRKIDDQIQYSMLNFGRRVQIVPLYSLVCSRCSIVPIVTISSCNPFVCMRPFVGHTTETRHGPIQRTYEYACMCEACTGLYRSLD